MSEIAARRAVAERSGGVCEICGRAAATNMHHRRRAGRVWTPSNLLHLCGSGTTGCHGMVTNTNGHRDEYEAAGWVVPSWGDPAAVTARVFGVGAVFLLDDGSFGGV